MLRFRSLGSGSSGNATVVEATSATQTTRLLIDCGFAIRELEARLQQAALAPAQLDAIFITHEHADHIGSACTLARRHGIAVWMSRGTYLAIGSPELDGLLRIAQDQVEIDLGEMRIRPFTVPHDAKEPLQLTCSDGARTLGVLTDLGHATPHVLEQLRPCQALLLECNHEPELLANSRYPPFLKQRVGGLYGHLANASAAAILAALAHPGLRHVVAAHLSQQNNRPELAQAALAGALGCAQDEIGVALALSGTPWLSC
jgi:phosphoribosyl 1,2-cyclic phosphodiesterase